jgi:hypothetical protein
MDQAGPYRRADAEACPSCKTLLLAGEPGTSKRCPKGCGEWCDEEMVEKRWGSTVDIDGDARLRWRLSNEKISCLLCSTPMSRVVNSAWIAHRCRAHGVWFEKDSRVHFERVHAKDIAHYASVRKEITDLAACIREAVANDPRAVRSVAVRIVRLEHAIKGLESEISRLCEAVNKLR